MRNRKPLDKISDEWSACTRCPLHKHRRNVVLGEGDVPCDVLFVGEAPGKTENLMGRPFIGPSGRLLRSAITRAADMAERSTGPKVFITNVCACRPTDAKWGPNRVPTDEEVWACHPRLVATVQACRPRAVVLLGKVAQAKAKEACKGATHLPHPAWILRMGGAESPQYLAFCADLSKVLAGLRKSRKAVTLQPRKKVVKKRDAK